MKIVLSVIAVKHRYWPNAMLSEGSLLVELGTRESLSFGERSKQRNHTLSLGALTKSLTSQTNSREI